MDAVVSEQIPDEICNARGDLTDQVILAVLSPTTDKIIGVSERQQLQNVLAVLLEIPVDMNDDVAAAVVETGIERCRLAIIAGEVKRADFRIADSQLIHDLAASI